MEFLALGVQGVLAERLNALGAVESAEPHQKSASTLEPAVFCSPATWMLSLTAGGRPCGGPRGGLRSASWASASARAAANVTKAPIPAVRSTRSSSSSMCRTLFMPGP